MLTEGAEPQLLDAPQADINGDVLLIVGDHRPWSLDEEHQPAASHRRNVYAHAQGPLTPDVRGD